MGGRNFIADNVQSELNHYRACCNFTQAESQLFDLRASGCTLDECCEPMGYSRRTIDRISAKVKRKMSQV